ncbi:hypothetical protein GCM10009332_14940 [Shewanella gelidii]|uniref:Uncharacterized protein n=1 Tax=Shewanella gelidii TaxID=1642821 RepID=A0A917N8V1_9GAMM|nr:hypothetical protein GCM10009332_14940 [Shewanella gelidii]
MNEWTKDIKFSEHETKLVIFSRAYDRSSHIMNCVRQSENAAAHIKYIDGIE